MTRPYDQDLEGRLVRPLDRCLRRPRPPSDLRPPAPLRRARHHSQPERHQPMRHLIRTAIVTLIAVAALFAGASAANAVVYGNSYGYLNIVHYGTGDSYAAISHDLAADGRRFCPQVGNATWTSTYTICSTTANNDNGVVVASYHLYWFRLCWQTHPNVNDGVLSCTSLQRIDLNQT